MAPESHPPRSPASGLRSKPTHPERPPDTDDARGGAEAPSTPVGDGRDSRGRFAPGNGYGRGNPLNAQVQRARALVHECVGDDDLRAVFASLVARATGDGPDAVAAARVLLEYRVGKPKAEIELTGPAYFKAIDRSAAEAV